MYLGDGKGRMLEGHLPVCFTSLGSRSAQVVLPPARAALAGQLIELPGYKEAALEWDHPASHALVVSHAWAVAMYQIQ